MKTNTFDPQQSIKTIEATLQRSNQIIQRDTAKPLILWGYLSVFVSLLVTFTLPLLGTKAHFIWVLMPLIGYPLSYLFLPRKHRDTNRSNPILRYTSILWLVLGLTCASVGFFLGFRGYELFKMDPINFILPFVTLILTIGMLITGLSLRIKAYYWSACIGSIYLIIWGIGYIPENRLILSFAVLQLLMQCVTGHFLQYQNRKPSKR